MGLLFPPVAYYLPCPVRKFCRKHFPSCIRNMKHLTSGLFSRLLLPCSPLGSADKPSCGWSICHPSVCRLHTSIHVSQLLPCSNGRKMEMSYQENIQYRHLKKRYQESAY